METTVNPAVLSDDELKKRSQLRDIWRRLRRNKLAMVGMALVLVLSVCAIFADVVAPYDYAATDFAAAMEYPSARHLMGTDNYGRDILSRVIYGGRVSLLVAVLAVAFGLVAGGVLGLIAGYFGSICESVIMRLMDLILAIPGFLLSVCISAALGSGIFNTIIAISIGAVPGYARMMRAIVMSIRDQEYVEAARVCGAGSVRTMLRHILPNTLSPIIVESTLRVGACIMMISSLSFIGLGVQPPTPEWGSMLSSGREFIRDFYPMVVFPGMAIMATLFGFNLFGDGLRDALDPRLKR